VALSILLVSGCPASEAPLMILTQFAIFSTLLLALPALWVWRWPDLWGLGASGRHRTLGHRRAILLGPGLQGGEIRQWRRSNIYGCPSRCSSAG